MWRGACETDRGLSSGVEDLKLTAVGGDCRESLRANGHVFNGKAQLVLPDPSPRRGGPADAVALLYQNEAESSGLMAR